MMRLATVGVLVGLASSVPVRADLLIAVCEAPVGWRVQYGDYGDSKELELATSADGITGTRPVFILDSNDSGYLYEIVDPLKPPGVTQELIDLLFPEKIKKYPVVQRSQTQVTAIYAYDQGAWTIAIYPQLGFVIQNRASHYANMEFAIGSTIYSKCEIRRE